MTNRKPGRIIILSGPSGSGKTTLHQKLLKNPTLKRRLVRSLSATTRAPRPGEKDGVDYIFLTKKDFLACKKRGEFLESMKVFDNYYGTPLSKVQEALDRGKSILLCIDVKGAEVVSKKRPDALKIFVKTPTLADLKQRLRNRGTESAKTLNLRLNIAKEELKQAGRYHYVIVNDRLLRAYKELAKLILRETAA